MTRTQRVWQIVQLLSDRQCEIMELAQTFGVSPSTIYRDLTLIQTNPFYLDVRQRTIWYIESQTGVR